MTTLGCAMNNLNNNDAFEQLFLSKQKIIPQIIRRYSSGLCPEDIEDITQQVAIKLFLNLASLRQAEAFDAWLQKIAINECHRHFASSHDSGVSLDDTPWASARLIETDTDYLPDENAIKHELYTEIQNEITHMPKLARRILTLHFGMGLGYRKIADRLGIPIGTVSASLFRARKWLRKVFGSISSYHSL